MLPVRGTDDLLTLLAANEVLGGNFLSRINMDLRETKGWSYGVAQQRQPASRTTCPTSITAPVQADKTGPAIQALIEQVSELHRPRKGVTAAELQRVINGNTRQLAGQFETSQAVLGALRSQRSLRRPDNY